MRNTSTSSSGKLQVYIFKNAWNSTIYERAQNMFPEYCHLTFQNREAAVEFMNCGKIVYSRVARVCKNDDGGSHKFRNRWTTLIKKIMKNKKIITNRKIVTIKKKVDHLPQVKIELLCAWRLPVPLQWDPVHHHLLQRSKWQQVRK